MWNKKAEANRLALIKEACRNGELKLEAQLQLAIASDQKAAVLAGIYVAAATAILGAIIVSENLRLITSLVVAAAATALALYVGAGFCIWSIMPKGFWLVGNNPSDWKNDISRNKELLSAIEEQSKNIDECIDDNRGIINKKLLQV